MRIIHRPNRPSQSGMSREAGARNNMAWRSHADVVDLGSCYEVRMTIRGVRPEHLSVEVRDGMLIVSGRPDRGVYGTAEVGGFQRLIGLPSDAGRLGATARLDADRLVVRVPRSDSGSVSALRLDVAKAGRSKG